VALLARFFEPQRGSVRIGGIDTSELPLDQVRSLISVVSQDTYLFCGSARDNIAMAKPDATDDEIIRAAKSAGIHDYLIAQPDGYDTIVGERGTRLSGGQRQRIAIARALLADRPILVLDEATASIDAETEAAVQRELDTLREGRTTLVIAHRLSTVRDADRIAVLDGGRIVELGTHDELVALGGRYAAMYETWMSHTGDSIGLGGVTAGD
jgi:ABC-type multidrug transport system fused ATPase/permease subunit